MEFITPAKFTMDEYGSTVVHAPSGSSIEMTAKTPTIYNYGFLETETEDRSAYQQPVNENYRNFKVIDTDKEDIFAKYTLDGVEY